MNIQCSNGHFYDNSQYSSCPYCAKVSQSVNPADSFDKTVGFAGGNIYGASQQNFSGGYTPGYTQAPTLPGFGPESDTVPAVSASSEDNDKTISAISSEFGIDPVVGWLVCIEGAAKGRDYRLTAGRNFIGRGDAMTVSIKGDRSISSYKHAILSYDPVGNCFFVMPGTSTQLFYLNGKVVLETVRLNAGDILKLGNTRLLFVPCCTESFSWNESKD